MGIAFSDMTTFDGSLDVHWTWAQVPSPSLTGQGRVGFLLRDPDRSPEVTVEISRFGDGGTISRNRSWG